MEPVCCLLGGLNSLATAILFNSRLTLGALFRIRLKPIGRLGVIGTLFFPELDDPTKDGPMAIGVPTAVVSVEQDLFVAYSHCQLTRNKDPYRIYTSLWERAGPASFVVSADIR